MNALKTCKIKVVCAMKIEIRNTCPDFDSYRAARVKSLFNVEDGSAFEHVADLPIESMDWKLGPRRRAFRLWQRLSIGRHIFSEDRTAAMSWPSDRPLIDAISPGGNFNDVTAALAAVGLGSVPSWLRPYPVLSNGESSAPILPG